MQSAITHLIAGVPVTDLDASLDWYTRLFGRDPDLRVGDEILWDVDEHATLFIEPKPAHAGAGRVTFVVAGLDGFLARLDAAHIAYETTADADRYVTVPDPDGNALAFVELD